MRLGVLSLALWFFAQSAWADVDRLIDAMGIPDLISAFVTEGASAGQSIDEGYLNGQGGDIWADTVRRVYDPARIEAELRTVMSAQLAPDVAEQALLFLKVIWANGSSRWKFRHGRHFLTKQSRKRPSRALLRAATR